MCLAYSDSSIVVSQSPGSPLDLTLGLLFKHTEMHPLLFPAFLMQMAFEPCQVLKRWHQLVDVILISQNLIILSALFTLF